MALPRNTSGLSPNAPMGAVADLGLGGMLGEQVAGETAEQRKKRMQLMQDQKLMGPAGSPATMALFGGGMPGAT